MSVSKGRVWMRLVTYILCLLQCVSYSVSVILRLSAVGRPLSVQLGFEL